MEKKLCTAEVKTSDECEKKTHARTADACFALNLIPHSQKNAALVVR